MLGASTWRIERITPHRVIVSPAPGQPGKLPFWHGDTAGRPVELGRAIGAFTRGVATLGEAQALERLERDHCLDETAARNLLAYLDEQKCATGVVPSDQTIVVERLRDELGDWRLCILTPFGGRVHAPWALAVQARLRDRLGADVNTLWSDDGIAIRLPEALDGSYEGPVIGRDLLAAFHDLLFPSPDEVESLVVRELGGSALFAARFRDNAARALLLPRRGYHRRTPLWQMRQRSADLLAVASQYGSFPILLETYRECLQDVFDVDALCEVLSDVAAHRTRVVAADTAAASPFASSLVFEWIGEFMYDGDSPLAERRAQALALDRERLRELLGQEELRELLDPDALYELERELQCLDGRRARTKDQTHDVLRRLGDLTQPELEERIANDDATTWIEELQRERRVVRIQIAGESRLIAIEDVGRYRDALGVSPPRGVPEVFLDAVPDAPEGLLQRWARTHGPFTAAAPAERWGLQTGVTSDALRRLADTGALLAGEFRPGGSGREYCDPDVLRSLRRRSLARLRREVEAVPPAVLGRFLPAWHGVGEDRLGVDHLLDAIAQIEGSFIPWAAYERDLLRQRVRGYQPRLLDELCASGELVWIGRGPASTEGGRVALFRRDRVPLLAPLAPDEPPRTPLHEAIRAHLDRRGASFFRELYAGVALETGVRSAMLRDETLLDALWDLVWSGEVTNDSIAPLRVHVGGRRGGRRRGMRLSYAGPPDAAGRWSLVAHLSSQDQASPTERLHALGGALLERYGVVTREAVLAEGLSGGFAAIYPVFRAMEDAGRIRRGYFVEGLGATQFALPGAVERLRAEREPAEIGRVDVLAAVDPANPYGAALAWPRRVGDERRTLPRVAGAYVVLVDGEATLYVERGGKGLVTLAPFAREGRPLVAARALARVAEVSRDRALSLERVNGEPVLSSPLRPVLEAGGFQREYLTLTLRLEPIPYARPRTA